MKRLRACLPRAFAAALILATGLGAPAAHAAKDWSLCGAGLALPEPPFSEVTDLPAEAVEIEADEADVEGAGVSILRGNVQIRRGSQQLEAGRVRYDESTSQVGATGEVRFWDEGVYVQGSKADVDLVADETTIEEAGFILLDSHARGDAEHVLLTGQDLLRVRNASYTTCNPDDAAWVLEADRITLDKAADVGTARNVTVHFHGVPIFYSPYLRFPLSDARKTGFLVPSFGVSGETGIETTVPFYLNIAPNHDATIAPRVMSKRGVLLGAEYRYLTERVQGEAGVEYLPNDAKRGEDRAAFSLQHRGAFGPRLRTDVSLNHVTDNDYLEDLGTDLNIASTRFLERRADASYDGGWWNGLARVQNYQTVDDTIVSSRRPYERLPQLLFKTTWTERNRRLNPQIDAEFVHFDRSSSVTGSRVDLAPSVSYPFRGVAGYLVPKATLRHTHYLLDDTSPSADDSPDRTLPILSLDSGLFMERNWGIGGREFVQTLEPRLFYLLIPFDDQGDLPVFDTGRNTFTFAQLFREDRFNGADRVGDANQLSAALTTRLLDPSTGDELLRASVGQIRYFRDRRVILPGRVREGDRASDLVAELAASITRRWKVAGGLIWDTGNGETERTTIALRYQPDSARVVNLAYRFVRDAVEQTDLSFRWPFGDAWAVVGRWNYSLPDERTLEAFGGVEYDSCCWALRAVARNYVNDTDGDSTTGFFLQLELKGLAGVGRGTGVFLERSIPGYRNQF